MSVVARPPFAFDDSYVRELEGCTSRGRRHRRRRPGLLALNDELAKQLGVDQTR